MNIVTHEETMEMKKKDEIYAGTYKNTWEHRRDIHKTKNKRMSQKQRLGQISAHANE